MNAAITTSGGPPSGPVAKHHPGAIHAHHLHQPALSPLPPAWPSHLATKYSRTPHRRFSNGTTSTRPACRSPPSPHPARPHHGAPPNCTAPPASSRRTTYRHFWRLPRASPPASKARSLAPPPNFPTRLRARSFSHPGRPPAACLFSLPNLATGAPSSSTQRPTSVPLPTATSSPPPPLAQLRHLFPVAPPGAPPPCSRRPPPSLPATSGRPAGRPTARQALALPLAQPSQNLPILAPPGLYPPPSPEPPSPLLPSTLPPPLPLHSAFPISF